MGTPPAPRTTTPTDTHNSKAFDASVDDGSTAASSTPRPGTSGRAAAVMEEKEGGKEAGGFPHQNTAVVTDEKKILGDENR